MSEENVLNVSADQIDHLVEIIGSIKNKQEDLKNAVDAIAEETGVAKAKLKAWAKLRYENSLDEERQKALEIFDEYEAIFQE